MSLEMNTSEPEEFDCIELHSSIQEVAKLNGIKDFEYNVDFLHEKGVNYIANIFRVLIKDSGKNKNMSVIVKTLMNTARQELFHELHKREVIVYKEVLRKFKEVQNNIDLEKRLTLPHCLHSRTDKGNELLILEDLVASGFSLDEKVAKFGKLDYLQIRLVLTELAKFHALTFIFQKKFPKEFSGLKTKLKDIIFQDSFLNKSKLRKYFFDSFENAIKVVYDVEIKSKLKKIHPHLLKVLQKHTKPKQFNVLCHGDCWINNVLFKHKEKQQSQVCFLDFQAMRYTTPASDIVYFIYLSTDSQFRSEYFNSLQIIYHDSFKNFLRLFNIDADKVYPFDDLIKDVKETLTFGLVIALIEMKIMTTSADDSSKFKGSQFNLLDSTDNTDKLYEFRVNDVVKESVDNGVLNKLLSEINK